MSLPALAASLQLLLAASAPQAADSAESLYVAGHFAEAEVAYKAWWQRDSTDYRAATRLGEVTGHGIRGALGTLLFRPSFGFDAGGIISHQFFRSYALTFDFQRMRLYLTPGAGR